VANLAGVNFGVTGRAVNRLKGRGYSDMFALQGEGAMRGASWASDVVGLLL